MDTCDHGISINDICKKCEREDNELEAQLAADYAEVETCHHGVRKLDCHECQEKLDRMADAAAELRDFNHYHPN